MNPHAHRAPLAQPAARVLSALVLALALLLAALAATASAKPIPGQYIVTVKQGEDPRGIARAVQASPRHVYTSALNGFAAQLNAGQVNALRHNPQVELIEQDAEVSATATQYMDAAGDPWGLDRIDQRWLPLSKTYSYSKDGTGVRAYILDTGLQSSHTEFGGRAMNIYNATTGGAADCNGHGTHVVAL